MKFLTRFQEPIYAGLRIVAGVLFACHGAQKLFGWFGSPPVSAPLLIAAGVIELGGGVLIAIGLFTSIAAFVASGEMAVAYFKSHAPNGWVPLANHGELAVVYCFLFLYIAARGSGRFAVRQ